MLWCKETFEQHFDPGQCRLFLLQQQLFDFVDKEDRSTDAATTAATSSPSQWLCFSIEFPSSREVSRLLSRHSSITLFQRRESSPSTAHPERKRVREDFSLLYGATPLSQQSRLFLAATYEGLRSILERIEPCQLHLYEIIREKMPCHLYFDVERESDHVALHHSFSVDDDSVSSSSVEEEGTWVRVCDDVETHQDSFFCTLSRYRELRRRAAEEPPDLCGLDCAVVPDNTETVDVLLDTLEDFVRAQYPSLVDRDGAGAVFEDVWVLQSLPPSGVASKFSQHYIVKFCNRAFDSTASVRSFVRSFVAALSDKAAHCSKLHRSLFFHKLPVWASVFRELTPDYPRNSLPFLPRRCIIDEAVYSKNRMMRCLGSCKLGKCSVLQPYRHYTSAAGARVSMLAVADVPLTLGVFLSTLITYRGSPTSAPPQMLHLPEDTPISGAAIPHPRLVHPRLHLETVADPSMAGVSIDHVAHALEVAFSEVAQQPCTVTKPRAVGTRYLSFHVEGTRYCQRVGREHKSNKVYLVVDLEKQIFVQKCFDPDCAAYRSAPRPLCAGSNGTHPL